MCGRYTLIRLEALLDKFPWLARAAPDLLPRYNIAPTQPLLAIASDHPDQFTHLHWGLIPSWAKDRAIGNRMINARAETLTEKPAFRTALQRRRCLIPADGFYEWQPDPASKRKTPMYIQMKDQKPFAFAGLWDTWQDPAGSALRSCTIITTTTNSLMATIHDRMPAILPHTHYRDWLDLEKPEPAALVKLLAPYPADEMQATPISSYVNIPKNEGPRCIESMAKETLF